LNTWSWPNYLELWQKEKKSSIVMGKGQYNILSRKKIHCVVNLSKEFWEKEVGQIR
jgi:hypothetical protein